MGDDKGSGLAEVLSDNAEGILVGVLAVAVLAAVVVGGFYVVFFREAPVSGDPASWGQLGDYLGGVLNPVFGFLSVFALLVALVLQTRELKLSRESLKLSQEELRLSREEQAKAADALAAQNTAIQKQSFEQTFFSMLRLMSEVLEKCTVRPSETSMVLPESTYKGRRALREMIMRYCHTDPEAALAPVGYVEQISSGVRLITSKDGGGYVVQYANTLLTTLEYMSSSNIAADEIYPRLLKRQLGRDELKLIYFLCFDEPWSSLKLAIEKFGMLSGLSAIDTGAGSDYATFFARSAFQE